jgi:PAS domain S-box-containing protein
MLADFLEQTRGAVLDELARRAAVGPSVSPAMADRRQLNDLIEGLLRALRAGNADGPALPGAGGAAPDLPERRLISRYLLEELEAGRAQATPTEIAIVAAWAEREGCTSLREQNEWLRSVLDDMEDTATVFAPDGRIMFCNRRAFQRLHDELGTPRNEVLGRTLAELGVPSELVIGRPMAELLPLALARETFEMKVSGRTKQGQFNAIYGPDDKVAAVSLIVRDVHSRKLAQTRLELLTKMANLDSMLDHDEVADALARIPIPEFADWCVVNYVEDGRIKRSYVAHRDPAQKPLSDAIMRLVPLSERHPLWQELLTSGLQLLTEVSDDLLRRLAFNDEQYHLVGQMGIRSLLVVPMVVRAKIIGIMNLLYTKQSGRRYGRDDPPLAEELALRAAQIFEGSRLMKDLKASEARFRIALACARTVVYEQDTSLRYVWYYNPLTTDNALGKTHEESFPAPEAATLTAAKRQVLEHGEPVDTEMDLTFGDVAHFRESIEPRRDQYGRITGVIGAATDISEQHRMRHQLEEDVRFREQLMGIIGHDLRNPLSAVIIAADSLLRAQDLSPLARNQMNRLRRSAGRMLEMIDTLLDFTRVRFVGKVPISRAQADLAEISAAVIDEAHLTRPDRAIELAVHGDPHGEWDPARLSQTISNLVSNAISYGRNETPVQVSIEAEGRDVDVKVHNEGQPIPADQLPDLFEPFHRGRGEDRSPGGLGLGLYIAQQIARAHEGSLSVESTEQDGTTFTLHVPRHHVAPAPAATH